MTETELRLKCLELAAKIMDGVAREERVIELANKLFAFATERTRDQTGL
jgi:hypothetical protein